MGRSFTAERDRHAFITGPNGMGMRISIRWLICPVGVIPREANAIKMQGRSSGSSRRHVHGWPWPDGLHRTMASLLSQSLILGRKGVSRGGFFVFLYRSIPGTWRRPIC